MDGLRRIDLRESLEAYAARAHQSTRDARPAWRAESLRLLNVPPVRYVDTRPAGADHVSGLCAIAPGVAVPTAFVDWPDAWDAVTP